MLDGATYPVVCKTFGGGVGRNIAEGLSKLFGNVHFISSVGNDEIGRNLKAHLPFSCQKGITISSEFASSTCTVIFDRAGDCKLVLGDMKIHQSITPELIIADEIVISKCSLIVMDGNISLDTMGILLDISRKYNKQVFFEPTDMRIAGKPFQLPRELTQQIKFISPNIFELKEIVRAFNIQNDYNEDVQLDLHRNKEDILRAAKMLLENVKDNFDCIILTLGEHGVVITRKSGCNQHFYENFKYIPQNGPWKYHFYAVQKVKNLINVSGAGDSFTSGFISAMLKGRPESECVNFGIHAAVCALKSESAVPDEYFTGKEHDALSLKKNAEYVGI